jgi:hypothetical protein
MPTNGGQGKSEVSAQKYRFYTTFGKIVPASNRRRQVWPWLAGILALVAVYGLGTLAVLLLQTFRTDFQNTRLPPYDKNLTFELGAGRFAVGETGQIAIDLTNPGPQEVTVRRLEVQVPPRFLDAFVVDDGRCRVERRADSSGTITCPTGVTLPGQKQQAFNIPVQAASAGNYDGQIRLRIELAVPAKTHPWYVPVDAQGNYQMVLERARRLDLRIVPGA